MKGQLLILSLLVFPLGMMGQSAREEIRQNPDLAAGKYYAYRECPATSRSIYHPLHVMVRVILLKRRNIPSP